MFAISPRTSQSLLFHPNLTGEDRALLPSLSYLEQQRTDLSSSSYTFLATGISSPESKDTLTVYIQHHPKPLSEPSASDTTTRINLTHDLCQHI